MINNFGGAYTMKSLEDESYADIQLLQICLNAVDKAQKFSDKKSMFYSKENLN